MKPTNNRLRIILITTLIISTIMGFRVLYLSTLKPEKYNILQTGEYTIKRGDILDRNGRILAISDELESVYSNPKEIESIEETASKLSKILDMPKNSIKKKLAQEKSFVWIKRQITPNQAMLIRKDKIKGIKLKKEYKRFYPNKKLASQILGFCNIDGRGVEGIEKSMDKYLVSNFGKENFEEKGTLDELDIILTIDANIQAAAEKIIARSMLEEKAQAASLILADGYTGEILCMANCPDFDPNSFGDYNQNQFRNFAIFNQFEPGSVLKVFSIAALLNSNIINRSSFFHCDGVFEKNNETVSCTGVHGTINFYGILKYSCNDGMLQACLNVKSEELYYYLKLFGFGTRTSINLPGEQAGILRNYTKWSNRSMLAIPLGQEVSVNALQIVKAATTFVNDGIMIEPFIVKTIKDKENKIIKNNSRKEVRKILKKGISQEILNGMNTSTDNGGTVSKLYVEGINFAAKSGTGEIYDPKKRKYLENDFTSSLLAIFPFERPRYIAYIVFHRPKGDIKWGGVIGAKALNQFLPSMLGYLNIPSDISISIDNKKIKLNREYKQVKSLPVKMPNLKGLSAGDVSEIFSAVNVNIKVYGTGRVIKQYPAEDQIINNSSTIKIYME